MTGSPTRTMRVEVGGKVPEKKGDVGGVGGWVVSCYLVGEGMLARQSN